MGGKNLQVSVPTIWSINSTQGVYKTVKASGGLPETECVLTDHLPRQSTIDASGQGSVRTNYPTDLSIVREPGAYGESEKVHTDSHSGVGISGLSVRLSINETIAPLREAPQNSAGCKANDAPSICIGEGNCMICREDDCHLEGHPISPIALPSSPDANEFHPSSELQSGGNFKQIQHNAITEPSQQGRPGMVAIPSISNWSTSVPTRPLITVHSDASNQGWGAVLNGQSHTGDVQYDLLRRQLTTSTTWSCWEPSWQSRHSGRLGTI